MTLGSELKRVAQGPNSKRVALGPDARRGSSETETVRGMTSGYIYAAWPQSGDVVSFNPLQSCKGKPLECFAFPRIDSATTPVALLPACCRQTTPCCGHVNFFLKFFYHLPTRVVHRMIPPGWVGLARPIATRELATQSCRQRACNPASTAPLAGW